jgi:hypothetical protein
MEELIVVGETKDATTVYVTELSPFMLEENGFHDAPTGLYLCEESQEASAPGVRVLAHVPDLGAAFRIADLMFGSLIRRASDTARAS